MTGPDHTPERNRPAATGPARTVLRILAAPFVMAFNILAALVLLFEEWGWRPLSQAIAWLARFRLVARAEAAIAGLPPYPSLLVFVLPSAVLFPVKIGALWLLAAGQVLLAGLLLAAAKVVSTALVARIFMLTKPALMRIDWFRHGYEWFMPWKEALFARVRASFAWRYGRMVKSRMRQVARRVIARVRPRLAEARLRLVAMWRAATGA